jgi:hypothetical protein
MNKVCVWVLASVLTTSAWAKLPAPSDEAKAKAAEAAAKTAHAGIGLSILVKFLLGWVVDIAHVGKLSSVVLS